MMELIFLVSLAAISYIYIGYPLLARLVSLVRSRGVDKHLVEPSVTVLISAFDEAEVISATLQNKLELDYPKDKLDVIVISDGSTDGTDAIVRRFAGRRVELVRQEPRAGKTSALNEAVPRSRGEILVFSDANSRYETHAIRKLVQNFSDSSVGYVTGKMVYTNPDGTIVGDGCTAYMRYENVLRETETKLGSVVGVDGGIDAIRRELYEPMRPDQLPDFVLPLKVVEKGRRVVYEPEAVLKEGVLVTSQDEYQMRVRVTLRAMWALFDMRQMLSFRKFGIFALQLWSHKVLRYLAFVFLLLAYLSNFYLLNRSDWYRGLFVFQNMAYLAAVMTLFMRKGGWISRLLSPFHYFALLNLAAAHAFVKFLAGQKKVTWTPRKG